MKNKEYWIDWAQKAGVRALKTFGQCAASLIPASVTITAVDWKVVLGTAALSAVASFFTSLCGLPELSTNTTSSDDE